MKEIIFKQWVDDNLNYNFQTKLTFAQCDRNTNLSWSELLRLTSDVAVEDFNMRNMSWDFLMENGVIFVVSRSSYHIAKMPRQEQMVTFITWEEKAAGPLFTRRYKVTDTSTGETLISGHTLWTLINFKTRKIIPAKDYTFRPAPEKVTPYEGIPAGRITAPAALEKFGSHKICFSDTDSNGHANNSKYMNFVIDCIPEKYQDMKFTDLRINYSKEATYGETIDLYGNVDEAAKKITVIGKVGENTCFETELYFA